jgi:hypothetical protein
MLGNEGMASLDGSLTTIKTTAMKCIKFALSNSISDSINSNRKDQIQHKKLNNYQYYQPI